MHAPIDRPDAKAFPGFREFVAIIAALMAINALGIDSMLPALPAIGRSLGIASENQRQWIIAAYVLGFGGCQLLYGPLIDRYGRRPILFLSLGFFAAMSILCAFAADFSTIVAARVLQGAGAAASRVLAVSIVRDRYSGRTMARVMSMSFLVFLAVPVLAPSIGQLIMLVAPWHAIFLALAGFGLFVAGWAAIRLPETLAPEDVRPISLREIAIATRTTLTHRISIGNTLAMTTLIGGLMGFINSSQQIFTDVFHATHIFPLAFAGCAGSMAVAAVINANIVERIGSRLISQAALIGLIGVSGIHVLVVLGGYETMGSFIALQALTMAFFPLSTSNFGAMAMEPLGHIAGTAASVQGTVSTIGGALLGLVVGQSFDGTTLPVSLAFFLFGLIALALVAWTERGRLFRPARTVAKAPVNPR